MLIGVDGSRLSVRHRTGTETYTDRIVRAILRAERTESIRVYGREPLPTDLPLGTGDEGRSIPAPRLWTHGRLSIEMLGHRPDVLFVPAHVVPLIHPRSVVMIHDLGYLHFPDAHPPRQRAMLDLSTRWSVRAATRIITPSAFTRDDLVTSMGVDPDRIDVISHGVAPFRRPAESTIQDVMRRYGIARPYVLAVGTVQPRKNFGLLAQAAGIALRRGSTFDLVIVGRPGWQVAKVRTAIALARLGDRLKMPGYVANDDLSSLYANASVFVQASLFEGFGMPVLEAMAAGVPVISSRSSSLEEVGGEAARYVDSEDPEGLAQAIENILGDSALAETMRRDGLTRATGFRWDEAATRTMQTIRNAAAT